MGTGVTSCRKGDEVVAVLPLDSPCSGCAEYCVIGEYDLGELNVTISVFYLNEVLIWRGTFC